MYAAWKSRGAKIRVGRRLKDLRLQYGLTQKQVAKSIGCCPSAVSVLENGRFGSVDLVEGYLYVMGLDFDDLGRR